MSGNRILGVIVNDQVFPRLNKTYSAIVIVIGLAASALMIYSALFNSADIGTSIIAILFALLLAIGPFYLLWKYSRLTITDSGLSFRNTNITWNEVTNVETIGYGIHISAGKRKIVVAPFVYSDSKKVSEVIDKGLKSVS